MTAVEKHSFDKLLTNGCISFVLILYVPVNIFLVMLGRVFLAMGRTSTKQGIKRLAQGHM